MKKSFTEHKTVQERILEYASSIGWRLLRRKETEELRNFDDSKTLPEEQVISSSLFLKEILAKKISEFNPKLKEDPEEIISRLGSLQTDIKGNKDFLDYLKGEKTYYSSEEDCELNLNLIDFEYPERNIYNITEEYYYNNGRYGNRADIVFLINGIPVIIVECKNATQDEALAIGTDQIRRYHRETPEMIVPQQIFTVTESLGFLYGVTWSTSRKNLFFWKNEEIGNLEEKVKSFFNIPKILSYIKNYIIFAEQDEELHKYILRQHQVAAVEKIIVRAHDAKRHRGLIWHTQGSGKTYTMITAAEILFKAQKSEKPTIILLIDRNELEDQLIRNLTSLGIKNIAHADRISTLHELLKEDYRGIVISMIHKFNDMPANANLRKNIYVLVDEAHRTTAGDLGNYLLASMPNATFIGFTGTPIDKIAYGKGTFKTFGIDDDKGYLDKYSISNSITDGTTLPLYYSLASSELLVPKETLEKEFLNLAEAEGLTDIEELNKVLERAVVTKNFLKGKARVDKIASFIADHFRNYVENLGYKAFLVAVDREACTLYKHALDKYLPKEYSEVVYTGAHNDSKELKKFHITKEEEKAIRKSFTKSDKLPKILIVTEKLLTGFDAPILYTMYLDKPMRDHTLLQAIARVNRPYEEENGRKKPFGFVLDFIGIFDKLEKALAFDSDDVKSVIRDIALLKTLFKKKMEKDAPEYLNIVQASYTDKEVDKLILYFKDKSKRKQFFKFYNELQMLYEIISPDIFLRPFIEDYKSLTQNYVIVRNAYAKRVYADREFQSKTKELVKEHVDLEYLSGGTEIYELNENTIELIKKSQKPNNVKVINLIKSIERQAEEHSGDLILISLKEKAKQIQDNYEDRIITTEEALEELENLIKENQAKEKVKKEKGFDSMTFFLNSILEESKVEDAERLAKGMNESFIKHKDWKKSEKDARELREELYYTLLSKFDDVDLAYKLIDNIFNIILKADENLER
jgi:type I restriction enzyme R subunit